MRKMRVIFRSGHVEVFSIGDKEVTWENRDGKLSRLNVPAVLGVTGVFMDVEEVVAFFVYEEEQWNPINE